MAALFAPQKDPLKVLELVYQQLNQMKAKIGYLCGLYSQLGTEDGRAYFSRVVRALEEDRKNVVKAWPYVEAALTKVREVKAAAAAAGAGTAPSPSPAGASDGSGDAHALQRYCQWVCQQLDGALTAECGPYVRPTKRSRTEGTSGGGSGGARSASPPPRQQRGAELEAVLQCFRELPTGIVVHGVDDSGNVLKGAERLRLATEVRMLCPKVFVASVLLDGAGQAAALRVTVDSADKAADIDPWALPSTQVFRRVSALATRVLTYFQRRAALALATSPAGAAAAAAASPSSSPPPPAPAGAPAAAATTAAAAGGAASPPASPPPPASAPSQSPSSVALEDLLLWLSSYRDLFTKRCTATGKLMAWDPSVQYPVPPVFRPFKCTREELRLRAVDLSRVPAYHMHAAPIDLLGWQEDVPREIAEAAGGAAAGALVSSS